MADEESYRSPTPEAAKPTPRPKKNVPIPNRNDTSLAKSKVTLKRGSKDLGVATSPMPPPKSNRLGIQVQNMSTSVISSIAEEDTGALNGSDVPKIAESSIVPGVKLGRSKSKALDDGFDREAMFEANRAMVMDTPTRKQSRPRHTAQTKAEKLQVVKPVSEDDKKDEERTKPMKALASRSALTTVKEVVPEAMIIDSSDEDHLVAHEDTEEETKETRVEQKPEQKRKTRTIAPITELSKKNMFVTRELLPVPEKRQPESPRKGSRALAIASPASGKVEQKSTTERPSSFRKKPKVEYTLEDDESTRAALTMFTEILELTKQPREWNCGNILKEDDYDYNNDRSRQLAEEYCHENAVDVLHCLFHKRADDDSLRYRQGRRDYKKIELQFIGDIDPFLSLDDTDDDVDYERRSINAHVTFDPYFRNIQIWDEWSSISRDAYTIKQQVCLDIIRSAPHVLRTESWALLLVMTILSKHELCGALKDVGIRVSKDWYNKCVADMLKRFCERHSEYSFLEVAKTFGVLSEMFQREPPYDDNEGSALSSSDEFFDKRLDRVHGGRPAASSKKVNVSAKQGTKRGSVYEIDGHVNKKRKVSTTVKK